MKSNKYKLYNIISEVLNVDYKTIRDNSSFDIDLGADSFDIVDLVMAIEKEFDMIISDDEISRVNTVGDALRMINEKVNLSHNDNIDGGPSERQDKPYVGGREGIYRQAQTLLTEENFEAAKVLLSKLIDNMDVWGIFAGYDLLQNANKLKISDDQKLAIAYNAATTNDYTDNFDETKDLHRFWRACYNYLGLAYLNSDANEAFKCFTKAANLKEPVAYNNVAYCYQNGVGVKKNYVMALSYYRKAKEAGYNTESVNEAINQLNELLNPKTTIVKKSVEEKSVKGNAPKHGDNTRPTLFTPLLTSLIAVDIALFISLVGGLNPMFTGVLYFIFLIFFACFWLKKYYKKNKNEFWGVPDSNGLMRTFFWRKQPYVRIFNISMIFLRAVVVSFVSVICSALLSLILFGILGLVFDSNFETGFCVITTLFLSLLLRKHDKALANGCLTIAIYWGALGWICYYYLDMIIGVGLFIWMISQYKKYKYKYLLATLPIIIYIGSIRLYYIHYLIYNTYGSFDYGVDVLSGSFGYIKTFFFDDFLPYVIVTFGLSLSPILLFLTAAFLWMIFAYALRFYDWITTRAYNVKHPCPYCQEVCEPAVYYSRFHKSNKLYELKTHPSPGVYGLFNIIHPTTKQKMPTLLINGRTKLIRKCHHCGALISSEEGINKHIALIGCPGSGKSALCISIIAKMLKDNPNLVISKDVDKEMKAAIVKVSKQGFMTQDTFPPKTREGHLPSIRINIPRFGRPDYALYIDDVAGETFDSNNDSSDVLKFLYNTNSLIFIIDPFMIKMSRPGQKIKKWLVRHKSEINPVYNIEDVFSSVRTRINEINRLKEIFVNFVLVKVDSGYLNGLDVGDELAIKEYIINEFGISNIFDNNEFKAYRFHAVTTIKDDGSLDRLIRVLMSQQNIH